MKNKGLLYCNECEDWVESYEGRCPNCNELLVEKKQKTVFDEWSEEDDSEWGTEENDYFEGGED